MNWTQDKIKHYEVCYKVVYNTPCVLNYASFIIMILVGLAKEVIWDWMLKQGTPSIDDFKADVIGATDGLLRKQNKFN